MRVIYWHNSCPLASYTHEWHRWYTATQMRNQWRLTLLGILCGQGYIIYIQQGWIFVPNNLKLSSMHSGVFWNCLAWSTRKSELSVGIFQICCKYRVDNIGLHNMAFNAHSKWRCLLSGSHRIFLLLWLSFRPPALSIGLLNFRGQPPEKWCDLVHLDSGVFACVRHTMTPPC